MFRTPPSQCLNFFSKQCFPRDVNPPIYSVNRKTWELKSHRASSPVPASAVDSHPLARLQSRVTDLEELLDLVLSRSLEVLDGDEVDGEAFDGGGGGRHLGGETHQVGHLAVSLQLLSFCSCSYIVAKNIIGF